MAADITDSIIADVFDNHRGFLPGETPSREQLAEHLNGPIQYRGLDSESRALLLSTLPAGSPSLFVRPMDKGLSGASVLAAQYRVDHMWSKNFVMKVGAVEKIEREARAMSLHVAPFIQGIEYPVTRMGLTKGLLGQELRGLTPTEEPTSLRLFIRNSGRGSEAIQRLFRVRLAPWYESRRPRIASSVRGVLKWYLTKAPKNPEEAFPQSWIDVNRWVSEETGAPVPNEKSLQILLDSIVDTPIGRAHGDLHSQNVLVDESSLECWPIDFGWCDDQLSPLVDFAMLECSIKFLAIPMRTDLRSLIHMESALAAEPNPQVNFGAVPYREELIRCLEAVLAIRTYAVEGPLAIKFEDYTRVLTGMTFCLSGHLGLNRPFVMAALQIDLAVVNRQGSQP